MIAQDEQKDNTDFKVRAIGHYAADRMDEAQFFLALAQTEALESIAASLRTIAAVQEERIGR